MNTGRACVRSRKQQYQPKGNTTMAQQQNQYTNRSRLSLATPAIRPGMKGRMLLSGPSGAGKTFTSLLVASVLAGPERVTKSIVMLDTEKNSGKTYADLFRLDDGSPGYMHVPWAAPFNATDLALTINEISADPDIDVVIVDSHSHFWRAEGGILDVANGKWTGWGEARPMHADMIDAVLGCDAHVILCARSTMEHVQETDDRGKIKVRKIGMKVQQDAELEFEMNVSLEMDMAHVMHVSKSRTQAVPVGAQIIAGHAEEFAGTYRDWLVGGEPVTTKSEQDALVDGLNRIADAADRQRAKRDFVDAFGRPEMLLSSRLEEAQEWVANKVLGLGDAPNAAPGEEPPAEPGHEHGEEPPEGEGSPAPAVQGALTATDVDGAWCSRMGCGHAQSVHGPPTGACQGVHVEGTPNTEEAVDRPCGCGSFVAPPPQSAPAPSSEPASTGPAPEAAAPAPDAQDGTQLPVDGDPSVREAAEAHVGALSFPKQVFDELAAYGKSTTGSKKVLTQRLVAAIVNAETPI